MHELFPITYTYNDIYYFVNNINPNIKLKNSIAIDASTKGEIRSKNTIKDDGKEKRKKTHNLLVISDVDIDFYQFDAIFYGDRNTPRYSTFMSVCKEGDLDKAEYLLDYCDWLIDLNLCSRWITKNRKPAKYVYASDLAYGAAWDDEFRECRYPVFGPYKLHPKLRRFIRVNEFRYESESDKSFESFV